MTNLIVNAIFVLIALAIMILSGCFPTVRQEFILPVLGEIIALCVLLQVTRYQEDKYEHRLVLLNKPLLTENDLLLFSTNEMNP